MTDVQAQIAEIRRDAQAAARFYAEALARQDLAQAKANEAQAALEEMGFETPAAALAEVARLDEELQTTLEQARLELAAARRN